MKGPYDDQLSSVLPSKPLVLAAVLFVVLVLGGRYAYATLQPPAAGEHEPEASRPLSTNETCMPHKCHVCTESCTGCPYAITTAL